MMCEWRSDLQQKAFMTSLLLRPCLVVMGCSRTCVVGICDGSFAKVEFRNNNHLLAKPSGAVTLSITVSSPFVESRPIRMWMP